MGACNASAFLEQVLVERCNENRAKVGQEKDGYGAGMPL